MMDKDLFQYVSTKGYKKNSPDRNNPMNIIPSGKITMKEDDGTPLEQSILAIKPNGSQVVMKPGKNYDFGKGPTLEIPLPRYNEDSSDSLHPYAYQFQTQPDTSVLGIGADMHHKNFSLGLESQTPLFKGNEFPAMQKVNVGYDKPLSNNTSINFNVGASRNSESVNPSIGVGIRHTFQEGGTTGSTMYDYDEMFSKLAKTKPLPKAQYGGDQVYTFSGRPDSQYKNVNGKWHIQNDDTHGNFVEIKDPTGKRSAVLNKQAKPVYNKQYDLPAMQPSETTQMFKPITNNAALDVTRNMYAGMAEKQANVKRAGDEIMSTVKKLQQNKDYTKEQKKEYIDAELSRLLDYEKRSELEDMGAGLRHHDRTHFIKAGGSEPKTAGDYAERAWDIATNPFDAAKYSISGGGLENMPWQYNKLKELGYDPSAQSYQERFSGSDKKSNLVGDALNSLNLLDAGDKTYGHIKKGNWSDAGLEAMRFLEVGAFLKPAQMIGKVAKAENMLNTVDNVPLENINQKSFFGNTADKNLTFTQKKLNPIIDHVYGVTQATLDPFGYALTSSQKNKLVRAQDEALEKAINFTEEWNFNSDGTIQNSVKQRMKDLTENERTKEALDSYNRYDNSIYNPMEKPNKLASSRRKDLELSDLTDKDKTYITKNRTGINGVNTSDASITLRNNGNYYNKPANIAGTVVHESGHSVQDLGQKYSEEDGWSKSWGEGPTKFDKKYGYYTSNKNTEAGREFAKYMVEPQAISPGSDYKYQTWKSSPNELHSDLMKARYDLVEKLSKNKTKDFRDDLINRLRDNPTDADIDLLLKNGLHKFFKYSTSQQNKRKLIRMLPALIPAVGTAAVVAGGDDSSATNLQQQKYGGSTEDLFKFFR